MKTATIALGVLCAALAVALIQRGASANRQIETLVKDQQSLSNQIAEIRTRMALAQVTSTESLSNVQRHLDKRTADLLIVSNRLVQTHLLLQAAQKDARTAHDQLQSRAAQVAVLETQLDALRQQARRPVEPEASTREKDALRQELASVRRDYDALQTRLGALQVEWETLQSQLFDLEFLDRQRKDAEVAADIRRRMASARTGASPDPRRKLELQPDGTVRYTAPTR